MPPKDREVTEIPDEPSVFESLIGPEVQWARYQPWLQDIGYSLRPRYRPGWKASWVNGKLPEHKSEDGLVLHFRALVLDAKRESDKRSVALKLVPTHTQELPIWRYLTSPDNLADPRNHCVPLLAIHPLPDTDQYVLAVMPLLLNYETPYYETVREALSAIYHVIQGIEFLHERNVAHLDICTQNTMMDPGANFFPKGFHPIRPMLVAPDPDSPRLIYSDPTSRTLSNAKYYIIDFGQSVMFNSNERHMITGSVGHHLNIPDFADEDKPYDPFRMDIRALGETFRKGPMQQYAGLEFLKPFVLTMLRDDPQERPLPAELLSQLLRLIESQSVKSLRQVIHDGAYTPEHVWEARVKRIHPVQPPIPGLKVEKLKPIPLRRRVWVRLRWTVESVF
ncbi:hypothetical protein SISSUDRAFT_1018130 [Sistotremastrum suecicum HHB10207 ss-3]|uniref:Protein kinase domain-containing protein n=1 Tax=Sistotremastrum suecicum HHB10207 ss-3 TaxID=1314776 RepID=A0A166FWM9_9AGAM|nr:hypothetical protein SISSUDRAFT_1018130 [Sistotremastrum suecicum HHB10207 ss-3]